MITKEGIKGLELIKQKSYEMLHEDVKKKYVRKRDKCIVRQI